MPRKPTLPKWTISERILLTWSKLKASTSALNFSSVNIVWILATKALFALWLIYPSSLWCLRTLRKFVNSGISYGWVSGIIASNLPANAFMSSLAFSYWKILLMSGTVSLEMSLLRYFKLLTKSSIVMGCSLLINSAILPNYSSKVMFLFWTLPSLLNYLGGLLY